MVFQLYKLIVHQQEAALWLTARQLLQTRN